MNYCQFRNDFIKRMANAGGATPILPPEYQQVEYLQSTGTQYINTGVLSSTAIERYYCKAAVAGYNSNNYLFGVWNHIGRCFVSLTSANISIGYATQFNSATNNLSLNTAYEFSGTLKPGTQNLYIDNTLKITQSTSGTPTPAADIYIFAVNNDYEKRAQDFAIGKLYKYELETTNGIIRDMYPCYRKSDNKPGMYDLATNTFFTNAGSGEFTVGNNV